ncbi:DUF448 domain-containing protein [Candidatus Saccharibacteria bacterium]|nr:DUF448 domain-containing protein [Candidatus Saccharibacteria bacterium]
MGRPRTASLPERTCKVCRQRFPKTELERWVWSGGELILDSKGTAAGRGWYSCRKADCSRRIASVSAQAAHHDRKTKHQKPNPIKEKRI